jgi:prepilin-type N-terminal cleavage/methylation domain-containing protein
MDIICASYSPKKDSLGSTQYGFSLLELVVVMGILAIFASVSLTFVGEKDVQQRYNESLEKLTMVKRNFLSVDKFQGQTIMHGFFIDNGMNVEQSFSIILKNQLGNTSYNLDKAQYKPFSATNVYLKIDSNFHEVKGATLYKGIRPGAYDLSQYQDSNNEIRDAWGEKFELGSESNTIQINNETYKNLGSSKAAIDINYSDLSISAKFIDVYTKNIPLSGEFKVAIVSFKNTPDFDTSDDSELNIQGCWKTVLSEDNTAVDQLVFALSEKTPSGARFDHTVDTINTISPVTPQNITSLEFTDSNTVIWKLFPKSMIAPTLFKFPSGDINIGSHVVVLLKKNASNSWKLYNHGNDSSPIHIFEYLHIFPGQIPDPITLVIP